MKPEAEEKLAMKEDVAAAFLGPRPIISRIGTIKEPPPLPVSPTKNPRRDPTIRDMMSSSFFPNFFLTGFHPDKTRAEAKRVKRAKRKIIGLAGILKLTRAPKGAQIISIRAKGRAIRNLTSLAL